MSYRTIEPGLARLISLGLDSQLPERVEEWKRHLEKGRVTIEMRDVFAAVGWLSSSRDSRLGSEEEPAVEIDPKAPTEDVDIREPEVKERRRRPEADVTESAAMMPPG